MSGPKLREAVLAWQERTGQAASEAEVIELFGCNPAIEKMDTTTLTSLRACRVLKLSSNAIERIGNLQGLHSLQVLSLSRNHIRKFENLDGVATTLRELWISYNVIDKLTGIDKLKRLKVLYMANNRIEKWAEFDRLRDLPELEDLCFFGNPIHEAFDGDEEKWKLAVLHRLPHLRILDGQHVSERDLEEARNL